MLFWPEDLEAVHDPRDKVGAGTVVVYVCAIHVSLLLLRCAAPSSFDATVTPYDGILVLFIVREAVSSFLSVLFRSLLCIFPDTSYSSIR